MTYRAKCEGRVMYRNLRGLRPEYVWFEYRMWRMGRIREAIEGLREKMGYDANYEPRILRYDASTPEDSEADAVPQASLAPPECR